MRDADVKRVARQLLTTWAAPLVHSHPQSEIEGLIAALATKAPNGHLHQVTEVVWLQETLDGKAEVHAHPYEAQGAVAAHEAANDPHSQYMTTDAANAAFAAIDHTHPGNSFSGSYDDLTDKPETFPPEEHEHSYEPANANIQAHISSSQNPHAVTKAQVGLGSVDNTSDAAKPISTAAQTALDAKEPANANIQAHVAQAHAPANAQKNSDILKSEIEAVLTGEISSHSHAGGGGGGMVSVRMTQDVANTTTSMASATGLSFSASANSDYIIDANLLWNTSATSVGIKLSADFSSTGHTIAGQWVVNVANGTLDGAAFNADDVTVTTTAAPFTTSNHAKLWAILRTGANAGTFVVRFAAETTGTITIRTGSVLRYEKTL